MRSIQDVLDIHTKNGDVNALVWLVARGDRVEVGTSGEAQRDSIFRIASMSKPVTAVAALILVEECVLRLDDPVDELLPELADRQVLVDPDGPIDKTVPANRAITVRDLLTFRMGLGFDFGRWGRQPSLNALADLGMGAGPPTPQLSPPADEYMRGLGSVPLEFQPGERWMYHVGADVLGVLIERATGQSLEDYLRVRIFDPLGMKDTSFSVPASSIDRFGPVYMTMPGESRQVFDPTDGQWASPPRFASGGGGLVSTVDDFFAFGDMLRGGGLSSVTGERILSPAAVDVMTTNHLTPDQSMNLDPSGALGWGFGLSVRLRRDGIAHNVGTYGWDGGLGTSWANDPTTGLVGVLLTNQSFTSPQPPPVVRDFWTAATAALT